MPKNTKRFKNRKNKGRHGTGGAVNIPVPSDKDLTYLAKITKKHGGNPPIFTAESSTEKYLAVLRSGDKYRMKRIGIGDLVLVERPVDTSLSQMTNQGKNRKTKTGKIRESLQRVTIIHHYRPDHHRAIKKYIGKLDSKYLAHDDEEEVDDQMTELARARAQMNNGDGNDDETDLRGHPSDSDEEYTPSESDQEDDSDDELPQGFTFGNDLPLSLSNKNKMAPVSETQSSASGHSDQEARELDSEEEDNPGLSFGVGGYSEPEEKKSNWRNNRSRSKNSSRGGGRGGKSWRKRRAH